MNQGASSQQAYQQILFQFPGTTYGDWLGHVFNWLLPEWITESTIAGITSKLATVLVWRKPDVFFDSDLTSMMSAMSSLGFLNERSRMLIVGHSHGSIYANLIHRRMTALKTLEPQQFRLMSIAAFVPRIEGGGSFVTNRNDLPVNAGRAVFSDVLAGTVTIANNEGTSLERGHNLIKQYLRDSGSLDQIKLNMKAEMDRLGSGSRQPSPVWQITYPPVVYNKVYWDGFCSAGAPCQRSASNGDPYATITFTQPYYEYGVINQAFVPYTGMVYKTGTLEQAKTQALANALVCYRAARDETVRLHKLYPYGFGPQYSFNTISGCAQNLGHWAGVWFAVSGDSTPVFRTSYYYGGTIDTTAGAVCKRS